MKSRANLESCGTAKVVPNETGNSAPGQRGIKRPLRLQGGPDRRAGGPPLLDLRAICIAGGALYLADSGNRRDARGKVVDGPSCVYRIPVPYQAQAASRR